MAAHKTNGILKFAVIPVVVILLLVIVLAASHHPKAKPAHAVTEKSIKNSASKDSAAESLDTLTAQLNETQQQVKSVVETNEQLKTENQQLLKQLQGKKDVATDNLSKEVEALKSNVATLNNHPSTTKESSIEHVETNQPITTVPELSVSLNPKSALKEKVVADNSAMMDAQKPKSIPYYTIPANATSVKDKLMTPLAGRIPVKGVVTDPYPFKLVFSDDTLAANGLRVPGLRQMVVSGYTEGDLVLSCVRGWVTSLTFVFADGTISTTSSNENNLGHFSKDNALGYLSDDQGHPFIRGHLITNAPTVLGADVLLGAAQGAANAYAQSQTTSNSTIVGTSSSTVTGSPGAYVAGQATSNAAAQVQQWWNDRAGQSFDAIYVSTVDEQTGQPVNVAVNFAKEIQIDYDPNGRKIVYAHTNNPHVTRSLD